MPRPALYRSQSFAFFGHEGKLPAGARPDFPARKTQADDDEPQSRLPRFDDKFAGPNALVLIQVVSGGNRDWVGAGPGKEGFGQVEKELTRAKARGDTLHVLQLQEHSLSLRAQLWGVWSDASRAGDRGYARVQHVLQLVETYNDAATQRFGLFLSWSWDLLRKAWRLVSDPGVAGQGKMARKLRAKTLCNLAGLHRRRGKTNEALRCLNKALVRPSCSDPLNRARCLTRLRV